MNFVLEMVRRRNKVLSPALGPSVRLTHSLCCLLKHYACDEPLTSVWSRNSVFSWPNVTLFIMHYTSNRNYLNLTQNIFP